MTATLEQLDSLLNRIEDKIEAGYQDFTELERVVEAQAVALGVDPQAFALSWKRSPDGSGTLRNRPGWWLLNLVWEVQSALLVERRGFIPDEDEEVALQPGDFWGPVLRRVPERRRLIKPARRPHASDRQTRDELASRWLRGESLKAIAASEKLSPATVFKWIRSVSPISTRERNAMLRGSDEDLAERWLGGQSMGQIAREHHLSQQGVQERIRNVCQVSLSERDARLRAS